MIKENYEEYIVEFSVTIVDPTYSELLSDPEAPHYDDVTRELTNKVRAAFTGSRHVNVNVSLSQLSSTNLHFIR